MCIVLTLNILSDVPEQTSYTQIKLRAKEQFDLGLLCLSFSYRILDKLSDGEMTLFTRISAGLMDFLKF